MYLVFLTTGLDDSVSLSHVNFATFMWVQYVSYSLLAYFLKNESRLIFYRSKHVNTFLQRGVGVLDVTFGDKSADFVLNSIITTPAGFSYICDWE